MPRRFNSNIGANHGWVPKGIHFPKVELREFDGRDVFMWVKLVDDYSYVKHSPGHNLRKSP